MAAWTHTLVLILGKTKYKYFIEISKLHFWLVLVNFSLVNIFILLQINHLICMCGVLAQFLDWSRMVPAYKLFWVDINDLLNNSFSGCITTDWPFTIYTTLFVSKQTKLELTSFTSAAVTVEWAFVISRAANDPSVFTITPSSLTLQTLC